MSKSNKDELVQSILFLAQILPGSTEQFNQKQLSELRELTLMNWVWYNEVRDEWKVTREGAKIYAEATQFPVEKKVEYKITLSEEQYQTLTQVLEAYYQHLSPTAAIVPEIQSWRNKVLELENCVIRAKNDRFE